MSHHQSQTFTARETETSTSTAREAVIKRHLACLEWINSPIIGGQKGSTIFRDPLPSLHCNLLPVSDQDKSCVEDSLGCCSERHGYPETSHIHTELEDKQAA